MLSLIHILLILLYEYWQIKLYSYINLKARERNKKKVNADGRYVRSARRNVIATVLRTVNG